MLLWTSNIIVFLLRFYLSLFGKKNPYKQTNCTGLHTICFQVWQTRKNTGFLVIAFGCKGWRYSFQLQLLSLSVWKEFQSSPWLESFYVCPVIWACIWKSAEWRNYPNLSWFEEMNVLKLYTLNRTCGFSHICCTIVLLFAIFVLIWNEFYFRNSLENSSSK